MSARKPHRHGLAKAVAAALFMAVVTPTFAQEAPVTQSEDE
jgi:hypothetical protein